jgi:hypothetical protein
VAEVIKGSFKNYCTCGGYARTMNGRGEEQPHMRWCPQYEEYAEYRKEQKLARDRT